MRPERGGFLSQDPLVDQPFELRSSMSEYVSDGFLILENLHILPLIFINIYLSLRQMFSYVIYLCKLHSLKELGSLHNCYSLICLLFRQVQLDFEMHVYDL